MLTTETLVVHFPAAPMAQDHPALDTTGGDGLRSASPTTISSVH